MSWLNHYELMLVRGIGNTPGETAAAVTNEEPLDTIDLMSAGGGITLDADGWSPQIAASKGNSVWADSNTEDGRRLISAANANVIETMNVSIVGSTTLELSNYVRVLHRFMKRVRDFWESPSEIQPPYIRWWANGAPGAQFALIYNIEAAYVYGDSSSECVLNAVLTVEREPYWRGEVPPGDNPKRWTCFVNAINYNAEDVVISPGAAPFIAGNSNLQNMNEYSNAGKTALLTSNFVDIPAGSIPGDAPALCWLYMVMTGENNIFAGVHSLLPQVDAVLDVNSFNGSDATTGLGTDATIANDTGGVKPAGGATSQRVEISFATITDALRLTFDAVPVNEFIGNWAAFLRCRQVNGTAGQILMYLKYGPVVSASEGVRLPTQNPQVLGTTGNTTAWGLAYMGVMTIPHYPSKAAQLFTGQGLTEENDLSIGVFASRSAGTGILYISDLILIPFDEYGFNAFPETADYTDMIVDTTGYSSRGLSDEYAGVPQTSNFVANVTLRGRALKLQPGRTNRIYFLAANNAGTQSDVDDIITPQIQIVPRWSGIRDV